MLRLFLSLPMKFFYQIIALFATAISAQAQQAFPQSYFRNPVDIPISLAGNFGECRPNHFHTGIDIKTNGKENLAIRAAADGYISRIAVSHAGYGNAIYLTHPNGYETVYAHLNDFYPELQAYLKSQQYERESWNLDMQIPANQFKVTKGQLIAYSGNTGGSTAPHLHFEIRDSKTSHVLNASLFGLPINDSRAPEVLSLAIYDADKSIYEQQPTIVAVTKKNGVFAPANSLVTIAAKKVRIGILANDYMEGSTNTLGIYSMELHLDNKLQAATELKEIDFAQNRYMNAFADYKLKEAKKQWYQGLYQLKGNQLAVYTFMNEEGGALDIGNGNTHATKIVVKDASGNSSSVLFNLQSKNVTTPAAACANPVTTAGNAFSSAQVKFTLDGTQLYDDICLRVTETPSSKYLSHVIQLHDAAVPMHHNTPLSIKLNQVLPFNLRTKLVFVHHIKSAALPGNNPQSGVAAAYENGWAVAPVRTFGNYYVVADTTAPEIKLAQKSPNLAKAKSISFTATDKLTSVKEMRAELDGKWLCFVRKNNTYTYTFDEHCKPGKHVLKITATDESGNAATYNYAFTH